MKKILIAAACFSFAGGVAAHAMSITPAPARESGVVQVANGCGWAGHRNYWGACVPNGRPFYRVCPPGMHLGPYGGACWRNW